VEISSVLIVCLFGAVVLGEAKLLAIGTWSTRICLIASMGRVTMEPKSSAPKPASNENLSSISSIVVYEYPDNTKKTISLNVDEISSGSGGLNSRYWFSAAIANSVPSSRSIIRISLIYSLDISWYIFDWIICIGILTLCCLSDEILS